MSKGKIIWIVVAVVLLVVGFGALAYVYRSGTKTQTVAEITFPDGTVPEPTPELSFGSADAQKLALTVPPGVSVQIMPAAKSLATARFDAFDVAPDGSVIVSIDSTLVDMLTGEDVFQSKEKISTFVFVGDNLAVIDSDGRFGFYDDGKLHLLGEPPILQAKLAASGDHQRLFFLRDSVDDEGETPALVSISEGSTPEVLTGSKAIINAVSADSFQTYFSIGGALFQLTEPGKPVMVLSLPDPDTSINGIAAADGAVYFSTDRGVYTLDRGIVLPLVLGIGGDIRLVGGSIYALDAKQRRIYRIALSKGRSS